MKIKSIYLIFDASKRICFGKEESHSYSIMSSIDSSIRLQLFFNLFLLRASC